MAQKTTTLGIIAGSGALPESLVKACLKAKRSVYVIVLKGHGNKELLSQVNGCEVRLGAVGKMVRLLHKQGVKDVVLIGGVRRPAVAEIIPDWKAFCLLCRVGWRLSGDDSLLRLLVQEAAKNGFEVKGVDELMPELVATQGVYGVYEPTEADWNDIKRGVQVAKTLGHVDVGQAVIVQRGLVLSVEGIEGTEALIKRTKSLKRKGAGGVLVKVSKPQQDRRVDLPTIGPKTVQDVYETGLKGIAVEAGGALLVDVEKMVSLANQYHLFIVGVPCPKN